MRNLFHPTFEMDKIEVPTCAEHAQENIDRLTQTSRRSFFAKGLGAAAVGGTLAAASSAGAQGRSPLPSLYPGSTRRYFQQLQFDEASHVNINAAAIRSLGGTVRPFPTFTGITNLTASQLLQTSVTIANTGVRAIFGAAPYISNPAVLGVSGSILAVEGYHAGFLNSISGLPLVPNGLTYDTALTIEQATAIISPFIVSLNDNGQFPATFSTTTKSNANDIAILNFAIIIDFLEASLYFNNVPRLFG